MNRYMRVQSRCRLNCLRRGRLFYRLRKSKHYNTGEVCVLCLAAMFGLGAGIGLILCNIGFSS